MPAKNPLLDRPALAWPIIIVISSLTAGIAVFGDALPLLRTLVTFWFLLVCPGMAFIRLLELQEAMAEWLLAISLSLVLEILLALAMVYADWWQPGWGLIALIALSLIGVALQVWNSLRMAKKPKTKIISS